MNKVWKDSGMFKPVDSLIATIKQWLILIGF
jgi:hypothetical protein